MIISVSVRKGEWDLVYKSLGACERLVMIMAPYRYNRQQWRTLLS